jgi:sugar lactone lactonase YvrE
MKFGLGSPSEKNANPRIERLSPSAAIPGGEITVHGSGFCPRAGLRPSVRFGESEAGVLLASDSQLIARVPENADGSSIQVETARGESQPFPFSLAFQIADNLHPVANPAIDSHGNIYVTFSGPRGQRVPVSLYKISSNYAVKPYVTSLTNPTGLAIGPEGDLYVSCRHDGTIHRVSPDGHSEQWMEGMGAATGMAFDPAGNLYVGDRSGTIFKISPEREVFVFATLEPSMSAYHLALHPSGELYVTGPTTSSYDRVYRITQGGEVLVFYRGLGRPQGMSFDRDTNLYLAASLGGRRGIVRISPQGKADHVLSGPALVGIVLLPTGRAILATNNALFTLDWNVHGLTLLGN